MEEALTLPLSAVRTLTTLAKPQARVICGDVIEVLNAMPAESVHVIITSPPYYGLRSYNIPPRTWADGTVSCLGLEPTLALFIAHLVEVFDAAKRVLRKDGTLWLNLGDSYAGGGRHDEPGIYAASMGAKPVRAKQKRLTGKDLLMVPARAALALQADGWILRQDNIWVKGLSFLPSYSGSVMPESTRDRTTWAHEHFFHLAQVERYYYDQDGCREPYAASTKQQVKDGYTGHGRKDYEGANVQNPSDVKRRIIDGAKTGNGRNLRNVWVIPKKAFPGHHFATFNPALVTPIIQVATAATGCCPACGAGRIRQVSRTAIPQGVRDAFNAARDRSARDTGRTDGHTQRKPRFKRDVLGTTWDAGCECHAGDPVPCVVMDIFSGSAACGIAAVTLGRDFVGIDVNPDYVRMGEQALRDAGAEVL